MSEHSWQPWRMARLDRPIAARPAPAMARAPDPAVLRDEARRQGHAEGHAAGYAEGRSAGYEDGFQEGRSAGLEEGLAGGRAQAAAELHDARQTQLAPLAALAGEFSEAVARLSEALGDRLVELAIATARQLARDSLDAQPDAVLAIVRELLHYEPALQGKPRLWLHPDDLHVVDAHLGDELRAAGWRLQPDDQISRGGCRASAQSGELDATWESRWEAVSSQLRHQRRAGAEQGS
ncbi:MAG: flagellar assembly protein FliH [Pseudomonas sp.]